MSNYSTARVFLPGCSLIPVRKGAKIPAVPWQEYQRRLPTAEEIQTWSSKFATSNVGCVTGVISGVIVLDIDDSEVYERLWKELGLDSNRTPVAATPRGAHIWFRHPGFTVPNSSNATQKIDLRGDGGFVVVPPSVVDGKNYTWVRPFVYDNLAPFPYEWAATMFPSVAMAVKNKSRQ